MALRRYFLAKRKNWRMASAISGDSIKVDMPFFE